MLLIVKFIESRLKEVPSDALGASSTLVPKWLKCPSAQVSCKCVSVSVMQVLKWPLKAQVAFKCPNGLQAPKCPSSALPPPIALSASST